jgi:hypothetical protein
MHFTKPKAKVILGLALLSLLAGHLAAGQVRKKAESKFAPLIAPTPPEVPAGAPPDVTSRPGNIVVHVEGPPGLELLFHGNMVLDPVSKKIIPRVKDPVSKKKVQKLTVPCDFMISTYYTYTVELRTSSYSNYGQITANTITDFTEAAKVNVTLTPELMDKAKAGDLQIIKVTDPQYQVLILQFNIGNRPFSKAR